MRYLIASVLGLLAIAKLVHLAASSFSGPHAELYLAACVGEVIAALALTTRRFHRAALWLCASALAGAAVGTLQVLWASDAPVTCSCLGGAETPSAYAFILQGVLLALCGWSLMSFEERGAPSRGA